ncbi:MAG: hypothetical protein CME71_12805 [Halobacteriovorax sp.]|nr:hypothetical protein [Halobacteriovorax sp.]
MLSQTVNSKHEKFLDYSIYFALGAYALGLVTSITLLAVAHICMLIPCIYFATKTDWKKLPKSSWALLGFVLAIILSVLTNLETMKHGWKPILKTKYFLYGFFSIAPIYYFLKNKNTEQRQARLIAMMLAASLVALIGGTIGKNTGFNPILMKNVNMDRNAGLMGMVLNYAHNLAYFMTIFAAILIGTWRDISKRNKIIYLSILALNIFALYTTYTRGAILAFIAGVLGYFLKDLKKFLVAMLVLLVIGVTGYFTSYKNFQREGSNIERLSMWKAAVSAYQEKPVFGWGYLNFEHHSLDIKKRYGYAKLEFGGHAHNSILEVMAATGTVGLISFLLWVGLWTLELFRREDIWSRVELAALCAFFVGGLTQSTIGLGINLFFIMVVYAISAANTLKQSEASHA